jgi:hypothetical protein
VNSLNFFRISAARFLRAAIFLASLRCVPAEVRYVDANSTNAIPPYTNWVTAATNIQDAVDAAVAGDEIVVTNGIYPTGGRATVADSTTNRVVVDKPLKLRSMNGPQFTTIDGGASVRCVYLTNGASLSGFTLTGGRASLGGGLWCESTNAVVFNCVVSGNSSFGYTISVGLGNECCSLQPGVFAGGGGVYGGTLYDCTLNDNRAETHGFWGFPCDLRTCTTFSGLGAALGTYYSLGAGGGAANATLNNCTLAANWAAYGGGVYGCSLNNCTLAGNTAAYSRDDGQAYGSGGGAYHSALNNCISYFNTAADALNYDSASTLNYSCATPLPTTGVGNTADSPLFEDQASGNLRLQSNSPCINAGDNGYPVGSTDLDGNPRIRGGTVDIGAYEFQSPASIISHVWLQQYGLPTDGSADFTDPDGDGLNNWQEWRCGTDPTNALSALRLLAPLTTGTNVALTWQSALGVNYFLERSTNLTTSPAFAPVAANIPGQPGTTTYIDATAMGTGPWFYRVGVSNP